MNAASDLEERVATLEKEMAAIRQQLHGPETTEAWLRRVSGRFKDDPEFDEIARLGREIRQAD